MHDYIAAACFRNRDRAAAGVSVALGWRLLSVQSFSHHLETTDSPTHGNIHRRLVYEAILQL